MKVTHRFHENLSPLYSFGPSIFNPDAGPFYGKVDDLRDFQEFMLEVEDVVLTSVRNTRLPQGVKGIARPIYRLHPAYNPVPRRWRRPRLERLTGWMGVPEIRIPTSLGRNTIRFVADMPFLELVAVGGLAVDIVKERESMICTFASPIDRTVSLAPIGPVQQYGHRIRMPDGYLPPAFRTKHPQLQDKP